MDGTPATLWPSGFHWPSPGSRPPAMGVMAAGAGRWAGAAPLSVGLPVGLPVGPEVPGAGGRAAPDCRVRPSAPVGTPPDFGLWWLYHHRSTSLTAQAK